MRIVLCPTLHQHDREVTLLDRLMHGTTDGAVLTLPEETNKELKALQAPGLPFVVVDPRDAARRRHPGVSAGARDRRARRDRAPARARAPPHRRDHGPARPGWRAPSGSTATAPRSPRPASCPTPKLVVPSSFAIDGGTRGGPDCSTSPTGRPRSSRFNDNLAIGVLQAARARGLRVPDDLSVVGFDDTEHAAIVTPALTTVRQPLAEMGRMAVSLLLRLLENQRVETLRIELATRLVVRDSTAPAPVFA